MFVRKNKNRSGSVSVQIVDKRNGGYKVLKTIGVAKNPEEIERYERRALLEIQRLTNKDQTLLLSLKSRTAKEIEDFLQTLKNSSVHTTGPDLIFGELFDRIGFGLIKEKLFRHLVVARLAYPTSKRKTVDYLRRYRGEKVSVDEVYRFLDTLNKEYKQKVEQIAFEYTKKTLNKIAVVFYDMTTLYFESEDEDDLRKIGFSKDGKFRKPQIMLGLLVGKNGYPIAYHIFEGNTFEGHTLLPVLEEIEKKYDFSKPTVIADAALLSKKNLNRLSEQKYKFIIGARIKNETDSMREKILNRGEGLKDGNGFSVMKSDGLRLVVTYSKRRAKKDAYNRRRGLRKLRKKVKSGKLTKEHINNRGYNKFLTLSGEVRVEIDSEKILQDKKWDGLKGYVTNTNLWPKTIVENYRHLWQIEKAFRISKTDLRIRPVHHHKKRRIEAHICIAFVAYTIYKELERILVKHNAGFSAKRASELTHNMYELEYQLPGEPEKTSTLLKMSPEQQRLYDIICKSSG